MLKRPKLVFVPLGAVCVVLFAMSAALGSDGATSGDPDLGQRIANITMPLMVLAVLVLAVLGIAYAVTQRRSSRG
jgi:hypothetical protein